MMNRLLKPTGARRAPVIATFPLVLVWSFAGCAADPGPETVTDAEEPESQGVVIPEMPVPPAVTINHVMVAQIDHAAHELWNAARDEQAPESDEDWRELQHHAIQLASGGTMIALGGTGQADAGYVRLVGWSDYAQDMTDTAMAALRATESQDVEALLAAGDALVESCEGCHREFKPDLPSEGYLHPHYIGPSN